MSKQYIDICFEIVIDPLPFDNKHIRGPETNDWKTLYERYFIFFVTEHAPNTFVSSALSE